MKILTKLSAVTVTALFTVCSFAGCAGKEPFMGNTGEVSLEEGDVFALIRIADYGDMTFKLFPEAAPIAVKKFIKRAQSGFYDNKTIHRVVKDAIVQGGSLTGSGFDGSVADGEYFNTETVNTMRHYFGALCMAKNDKGNYCQFYMVSNSTPTSIDKAIEKLDADLKNTEITDKMTETDKAFYSEYLTKLKAIPADVKERYARVGGIYDYDGNDTVFGQLVDGADVLKAINQAETVFGNNGDDKSQIPSKPLNEIIIEKIEIVKIAPEETVTTEKTKSTKKTTTSAQQIIVDGGGTTLPTVESDNSQTVSTASAQSVTEAPTEATETAASSVQTPSASESAPETVNTAENTAPVET